MSPCSGIQGVEGEGLIWQGFVISLLEMGIPYLCKSSYLSHMPTHTHLHTYTPPHLHLHRLYFGEHNVAGMFTVLEPLHLKMEKGPETLKEISFNHVSFLPSSPPPSLSSSPHPPSPSTPFPPPTGIWPRLGGGVRLVQEVPGDQQREGPHSGLGAVLPCLQENI